MADQLSRISQRKLRDQASASLDELRQKLEISPTKSPNRRKSNSDSQSSSYSASVERLKELIKRHEKSSSHRPSSAHDQSLHLDIPPPDELAPLLDDQHSLLQHLESQVSYYKESLNALKQKAEIVIEENSRLHRELVSGIQNEIGELDRSHSIDEESRVSLSDFATQTENCDAQEIAATIPKKVRIDGDDSSTLQNSLPKASRTTAVREEPESKLKHSSVFDDELTKLKNVHAIKTKQLESMLKSTREELEENKSYIKSLEARKSEAHSSRIPLSEQEFDGQGLCIKCAHNKAVISGFQVGANDKILKRMERENSELLETIKKQCSMLDDMKRKETDAFLQVKRSCELAEEIQLQKQEIVIKHQQAVREIGRLKEEHKKQLIKVNESAQKERIKMQSEHEQNVGALTTQLNETTEKLAKTEIQLERATREKLDIKSSLNTLEDYTANQGKEMIEKLDAARLSLAEVTEENTALKQQNQRLENEKKNLEVILEERHLSSNDELSSLRKRLAELTQKLETYNQECIWLTEELHKCQKQLQTEKATRNLETISFRNQIEQMEANQKQREEKLLHALRGAEENHAKVKTELSSMLESQIEIGNRLKEEYKKLLEKQKDLETKTILNYTEICEENKALKEEISILKDQNTNYSTQESELYERIQLLEKSLADAEVQVKTYYEKSLKLLPKYNNVLKERQHLRQEVEFLRSQLTDFRPNTKISISDLDNQPV